MKTSLTFLQITFGKYKVFSCKEIFKHSSHIENIFSAKKRKFYSKFWFLADVFIIGAEKYFENSDVSAKLPLLTFNKEEIMKINNLIAIAIWAVVTKSSAVIVTTDKF